MKTTTFILVKSGAECRLFWCLNRFHTSGMTKQEFGIVNSEDMAGHTHEDRYANVDLVCALCDNGGEIIRWVCTFSSFFYLLSIMHFLPG